MLLRAQTTAKYWWDTQIESELPIYFALTILQLKGVIINLPEHPLTMIQGLAWASSDHDPYYIN